MNESEARAHRDALLASSDWTRVDDAPLTGNERARWKAYRQALRDVPEQPGFPDAITWPPEPERDPPSAPAEFPTLEAV